jgi:predicted amidophosphoribosyltransferase
LSQERIDRSRLPRHALASPVSSPALAPWPRTPLRSLIIDTLRRELLSLIVPPLCVTCLEPEFSGSALCPDCRARLVALPAARCRRCGAPVVRDCAGCRECRGRAFAFTRAWCPFAYEGVGRRAVNALKSRGALAVAGFMGGEIARRAPSGLVKGILVPVPAHARRRRQHGFNPAGEIAHAVGRRTRSPVRDLLQRTGRPPPQVGLERAARLDNARGSVDLRPGAAAPARAVLVDDVYTTGATLDACARTLRAAGSREVTAVTFARAVRG